MSEKAVEFLKKCIEIYSPSGNEENISKFIAEFLKRNGFLIKFDNIGNIIAEKGEGKPNVLLVSHLDTIPGELPVILKEGRIYGRGAIDCKASLAAMVYSISQFRFSNEIRGKITFGGIVREEKDLEGINEFVHSDIKPDYAVFGEPTKINQICIGYKGRLSIAFKILSQPGHVASSWQYVNAIEVGIEIWKMIKGLCQHLTEMHCQKDEYFKYYNTIIPNITIISGGHLTNCIPSECTIHIDIRFPPTIKSDILLTEIRNNIINFKILYEKEGNSSFRIQESITSLIEGFEVKPDELIIGALRWSVFKKINEKPKLIKKTGTTFINTIGLHYRIPSITYGPGDPKIEHTDKEFIEIDEYLKSIEIYKNFLSKFFELYYKK